MPAGSNQSLAGTSAVFADGVITGTVPGGTADGIVIGYVQDITMTDKWEEKDLMGAGTLFPVAVADAKRSVEIKIGSAQFTAQGAALMTGATLTYSNPNTTAASLGNDHCPIVKLTVKTPADGSDLIRTFTKVKFNTREIQMKLHEFLALNLSARAFPDAGATPANAVYVDTLPGNQTST